MPESNQKRAVEVSVFRVRVQVAELLLHNLVENQHSAYHLWLTELPLTLEIMDFSCTMLYLHFGCESSSTETVILKRVVAAKVF